MSDLQIHINRAGQQYGPYPEATAREMLAAGQLLPTDLAWHSGAEGWKTLQEVLGAEAAQASPAPPPPSNPAGPPKRQVAGGQPAEEKKEEPKEGEQPREGEEADDPDKIHVTRKGEPIGPYPRDKAREYFIEGTLLPTDWAWHDGMGEDWKPLNEVLELPLPAGAGGGGSVSGGPWTIVGCLSEGWQIYLSNLGGSILFYSVAMIVLLITILIPILNPFVAVPVVAGFMYYFIKLARREPAAIGDLVAGFKRGYGQLLLVALFIGFILIIAILPGASVWVFFAFDALDNGVRLIQDFESGKIGFRVWFERTWDLLKAADRGIAVGSALMTILPIIALSFLFFSMPLVIDRQMKAIDSIVASARLMKSQFFKVLLFSILIIIFINLGASALLIGVLFTGPIGMSAWAVFYLKNVGSITAAHTAPVAKNMKIGLICGALLPVGAAIAAVVMAGESIKSVAAAIDSNGTSEDAGNSGGAQTVDLAKELPGVYLIGAPQTADLSGRPEVYVMTLREGGKMTMIVPLDRTLDWVPSEWKINPDTPGQFQILLGKTKPASYKFEPGLGISTPKGDILLNENNITGAYSFSNGTTQGRLVLKKNQNAEMWVNNQKTISSGRWYVSGGQLSSPYEIWFMGGGAMQLILSLDTNTKPFSMKSVARLTYDQATKKFTRVSLPLQGQIAYTRAKVGGGQGGGQGGANESPEPEE